MEPDPIDVQKALKGAGYPASKSDLVALAQANGAPEEVIEALQAADAEQFDGPDTVQRALS